MNIKILATLLILLTAGLIAAETDMSIYDRNNDMNIDAEERIILDIDIENARISNAEARVIDTYTIDGTVILNEEFQAAFLNARTASTVTDVEVTGEPRVPVNINENDGLVENEEEVGGAVVTEYDVYIGEDTTPTEETNDMLVWVVILIAISIVGMVIYAVTKKDNEEK